MPGVPSRISFDHEDFARGTGVIARYTGAMSLMTNSGSIEPGTRVRVAQQMPQTGSAWVNVTEGVIVRYRQAKTGSWFAHAKDDQLWLDRLEVRLDDGELVILNLDQYSVIEPVPAREA